MKFEQRTDDFRLELTEYELLIIRNALLTELEFFGDGPFDFEGAHELLCDIRQLANAMTELLPPSLQLRDGPVLVDDRS
jgi:hypothetical protein